MQRMSALDASFLHMERDENPMHIGSVAVFEGPAPSYDELLARIAGKLPLVPRYRQVPRFVPLDLGRPGWQDDPHFSLAYHVRHTALPAPGGDTQLRTLAGRVFAQKLDRSKPLWELWMVEGLADGHWAVISKVHHAIVDGVSGTDLMAVMFDREPAAPRPAPEPWRPAAAPSTLRISVEGLADRVVSPLESAREAVLRPRVLARQLADAAKGTIGYASIARPVDSSLNGPIGPHRAYAWGRVGLDDVKTVRAALGGTINDVVLALCTRGFRDLLLSRGEPVDGVVVRTLVPVSVRKATERGGVYDNKVSAIFAELPVSLTDPVERLHSITRADEGAQGVESGGRRGDAHVAVRLRAAAAALARQPAGGAAAAAQPADRDRPTCPGRSSRSTWPGGGCSRPTPTSAWRCSCGPASRSSPTSAS